MVPCWKWKHQHRPIYKPDSIISTLTKDNAGNCHQLSNNDASSLPFHAAAKRLEHIRLSFSANYDKNRATRTIASITSQHAKKLFQKAVDCLANAKRNIAEYLTISADNNNNNMNQAKSVGAGPSSTLEPKCSTDLLLVVLVTSRPGSFANRAAIRLAWGRMDSHINAHALNGRTDLKWKTIFSIGLANSDRIGNMATLEHEKYKDILRLPYKDSYKNLPNKTMNSLEWIANSCKPKYVLKTDDDCYVSIFNMLYWLKTLPSNYEYIGRVNTQMPVIRDPKHRNYVPEEEHKANVYRPYCAGGGYILKGDILKNITDMGKLIKQIINEDAYMGMLANALKIVPRNEERFLPFIFFGPPVKKLNMCDWKDKFLVHNVFGKKQLIMHFNSIAMDFYGSLCEKL
eukprot:gene6755-7514_t